MKTIRAVISNLNQSRICSRIRSGCSKSGGRPVKIVAPLLVALPPGLACRVILCERDLDEVLDSQERMLRRRNQPLAATPERRRMLKDEYERTLDRAKAMLTARPDSQLLVVRHGT